MTKAQALAMMTEPELKEARRQLASLGGKARAKRLSKKRRLEIAMQGVRERLRRQKKKGRKK